MANRGRLPIKLGTREFLVDLSKFERRPLASIRQQVDQGQAPGEQSFDNQGIWKRIQSDFVIGAGQQYFDQEDEADRRRFRKSKGINPWTRRTLSLQRDAANILAAMSASAATLVLQAGTNYIYAASNTNAWRVDSVSVSTPLTGVGAGNISDMTAWGDKLFFCQSGGSVIKQVTWGGTAASTFGATTPKYAQAVNGRLVCLQDNLIYELDNAGAKVGGVNIFSHPQSSFEFTRVIPAPNGVYVTGNDTTKSVVYLLTVTDANGAFAAPYPVMETLNGEFINDMLFYGGVMFMATTRGVRLATINGSGFLTFGPVITDPGDCKSLMAFDDFVWFGWTNFDATSTGLGRLSPKNFTAPLVPAFASDIMTTSQGTVMDIAYFAGAVHYGYVRTSNSSSYLEREHGSDFVSSGTFYSGGITYGTPELKAVLSGEAVWDSLPTNGATIQMDILDGIDGTATTVFTNSTDASTEDKADITPLEREVVEVKLTITRGSTTTNNPKVRRWTLRSLALPFRSEEMLLPIILGDRLMDGEYRIGGDPYEDFTYLFDLMTGRSLVDLTIGSKAAAIKVQVDAIQAQPGDLKGMNQLDEWPYGTWLVRVVTVP